MNKIFLILILIIKVFGEKYGKKINKLSYLKEIDDNFKIITHIFPASNNTEIWNDTENNINLLSHNWSNYYWKRESCTLELKVGDCHVNNIIDYSSMLEEVINRWNNIPEKEDGSGKILKSKNFELVKNLDSYICDENNGADGMIQSFNNDYGNTGWAGLAQIFVLNNEIIKALSKINEYYSYTNDERRHLLCHEIGHGIPLGHQSTDFNLDTHSCMDYSLYNIGPNLYGNEHDIEIINNLYNCDECNVICPEEEIILELDENCESVINENIINSENCEYKKEILNKRIIKENEIINGEFYLINKKEPLILEKKEECNIRIIAKDNIVPIINNIKSIPEKINNDFNKDKYVLVLINIDIIENCNNYKCNINEIYNENNLIINAENYIENENKNCLDEIEAMYNNTNVLLCNNINNGTEKIYRIVGNCSDDSGNIVSWNKTIKIEKIGDSNCESGILDSKNTVCCLETCETCGGVGCSSRDGGGDGCCGGVIKTANNSCLYNLPPCVMEII